MRSVSGYTKVMLCVLIAFFSSKTTVEAEQNGHRHAQQQKIEAAYAENLKTIELFRKKTAAAFAQESDAEKKSSILALCRDTLFCALSERILPAWYGTKWSFDGYTATPGRGSVACGYFVTRVLDQLKFRIKMYGIAQQPPAYLVYNLSVNKNRFVLQAAEDIPVIKNKIREKGKGIYVVGLDCHVGFIVYNGEHNYRFVHSSYYEPPLCVVSEPLDGDHPLADSGRRVVGKLFDDRMLVQWLRGEKIKMKYCYKPDHSWWDILSSE